MATIQKQMGKIVMKTKNSPTLSSGTTTVTFGGYEKVVQAAVFFEGPNDNTIAYEATTTLATNVVTITFKETTVTGTPASWSLAGDNDLNAEDIVVVADCI